MKRQGVITSHYGVAVDVRFANGEVKMVRVKRNSGHVVGDAVEVEDEILSRLPRRTEIRRMDARNSLHTVGANLDLLCIVATCEPLPPPGFIARAIVAARSAELTPVLLLNKSDLSCFAEYAALCRKNYSGSLPIFELCAERHDGLETFAAYLNANHRGIFVGPTGVGKSSILNGLVPDIDLATGEISESRKRGRHTTTVSTLHTLPGGGELIDSPGFNDFGLVDIGVDALALFFPGFETALETPCRFRDCRHREEPGCSIHEARAAGTVGEERYSMYLQLLAEVEGAEANSHWRERRKRRKK
ncbi:ribosome small subunit-dependent GTPase A [Desulforhopalus vacuolatus]|uniref:ribosome small subunit-dependent GTPase A n=1 Tax=Desulforhopalus vacuolatus TaxID=40414 RepID=UPI001966B07B|nr:ribosome small subunit-dependent GTPase A [Desulforhopalus vacuolatus]MBM9518498.1 ribosome small subunit-dependent GTPase A [Desulforhopalus vacuolatus]